MSQVITIHAVMGTELKTMLVLPCGVAHECQQPGELAGPSGEPLSVTKVMIHLNSGMKVVVEESLADLERMYNGERDDPISPIHP